MMRTKRISSGFAAAVLSLSTLMSFGFTGIAHAITNTCTWTGATNNNFATATNWSGCGGTAPQNGNNLVFDASIITAPKVTNYQWTLTNNITGLSVGSVTFSGTNSNNYDYVLIGNGLTLNGGISVTSTQSNDGATLNLPLVLAASQTFNAANGFLEIGAQSSPSTFDLGGYQLTLTGGTTTCNSRISFNDVMSNAGDLTSNFGGFVGFNTNSPNYVGNITINSGTVYVNAPQGLGDTTSGYTTLAGTGNLYFGVTADTTYAETLILGGSGNFGATEQYTGQCGGSVSNPFTATLSGPVSLTSDVHYTGDFNTVISNAAGYTPNGHAITVASGIGGIITTPAGTVQAPVVATTVASTDSQPTTQVNISNNQTVVLDGIRGDISVSKGGILKGTGTAQSLYVSNGGIVAPGHSPGTLTVVTTLNLAGGSTYQAELKDALPGDFDQIVVGKATDTDNTNPDVTLGDGTTSPTLATSLYAGYKINQGDSFMIINNLSKTAVKGTFNGLAEGATFKVGTAAFSISYKGGDGNDVVLTALSVPTTPDTGFAVVSAHPGITLGLAALTAGALMVIGRHLRPTPVRVKAKASRRRR